MIQRGTAELTGLTDGREQALSALAYKVGGYLAETGQNETHAIDDLITAGTASGPTHLEAARIVRRAIADGITRALTPRPTLKQR